MAKTILFLSGPALGHVSRLGSVAKCLRDLNDVRVLFAVPDFSAHTNVLTDAGFEVVPVEIAQSERSCPAVPYADRLEQVFRLETPDIVVHDMCPLRWLPAVRFPDVPRVSVTNFFLTGPFGRETAQTQRYKISSDKLAGIRAERGLPPLASVFDLYEADHVLLADPKAIIPADIRLPSHYAICGPVFQDSVGALPPSLADETSIVLLSMGSTGRSLPDAELVTELRTLSGAEASVYAGTRVDEARSSALADHYYNWLPLNAVMPKCRMAITQGGAGSTYMALAYGVPVAVVPTHANHRILGDLLEDAGLGLCLSGENDRDKVAIARYSRFAENALALAQDKVSGSLKIAQRIAELLT